MSCHLSSQIYRVMEKTRYLQSTILAFLLGLSLVRAQGPEISIHAVLIDKELNQKAVPRMDVVLTSTSSPAAQPLQLKTDLNGVVKANLDAGAYTLTTPQGIEF